MRQRNGKRLKSCKQIVAYVMMFAMLTSLLPATVVKADEPESEPTVQERETGLYFSYRDDDTLNGLDDLWNIDLPDMMSTSWIFAQQGSDGITYKAIDPENITVTYCREILEDDDLRQGNYEESKFTSCGDGQMRMGLSTDTMTYDSEEYHFQEGTPEALSIAEYEFYKSGTYRFTYTEDEKAYSCYVLMTHRAWDFYETDEITDNPLRAYYYQDVSKNPTIYVKRDDPNFELGKITYDEKGEVVLDENGDPVLENDGNPFEVTAFEWDENGDEKWTGDCSNCISYKILDNGNAEITLEKDPSEVTDRDITDYTICVYFHITEVVTDVDGNPLKDDNGNDIVNYWYDSTELWIHNEEDPNDTVWIGYDNSNGSVEWQLKDSADSERQVLQPWCEVKGDKNGIYDVYLTEKPNCPDDFDWDNATEEEVNQYGWREGAKPVVRVNHDDGTIGLYKVGDANFPIDDCGDKDPKTWHFIYPYQALDGVSIFWSDYDAFEFNQTEQFQIEMDSKKLDAPGSITITPEPDQDNQFTHQTFGRKYNYSIDQIGKVAVTFTPKENWELDQILIGDTWYVNETYKGEEEDDRPTFKVNEDGSYTHTFTKEELMEYNDEMQDGEPVQVPATTEDGKQLYRQIRVGATFNALAFEKGFEWSVDEQSQALAAKAIKGVSYKVNGDTDWSTLSDEQLKSLYFPKRLEDKDTITVKMTMNDGYTLNPSRSWVGYYNAEGQRVDYPIAGSENVMQDIVNGMMSSEGYTFTYDPQEHSKDEDGNPTITEDAILSLSTGVMKTYAKSCNIRMFVQSEVGKDDNGSIIYGALNENNQPIEDMQWYPDMEFTFNENPYGGQCIEPMPNDGDDPISIQYISTIPGENKGKLTKVTPSNYLEFEAGGNTSGDTSNVIRISDRLIDEVYIDKNMDGTFAEDELEKPGVDGAYEISLAAAEGYNILIRKRASDDATISWSYIKDENDPEQDNLVEHGKVYVKEIKRDGDMLIGNVKYDKDGSLRLDEDGCPIYDTWKWQDINAEFYRSHSDITARNGDEVTLLLVPDYGYQLKSMSVNGQEISPQKEVSTFKVTLNGNLHFSSIFEKADNVTAVKAKEVSAATIADGENAADSGNLSLTVENNATYDTDVTSAVKLGTDETIQKITSLDMTLDNIVSKGIENEYWTKNISSFEDAITVGLTLKDMTLAQGESLAVVRDHESKLTQLDAKYDATSRTLTFPTNQFSTYTIVKIVKKENKPEPTPNPEPKPEHKHNLVKTEEKAATATTAGNKAYWTCSDCGKVYSDAEGTTETTVAAMTIAATGVPKKGTKLQDAKTGVSYVVTSKDGKNPTVTYSGNQDKKAKTITVPSTVTIDGVTYKVTAIADNAFKNNKKVTKVVIPSNIITIGKNAFNGCSRLKTIQIKSTKITNKSISKNAFKGLSKRVTIKVPKKKLKEYKKLFRKKGLSKKVKLKS